MRAAGTAAAVSFLAGCSPAATNAFPAESDELIECALAGAAAFARECAIEQTRHEGAVSLVVRHPDGAFRRFDVTDGSQGLVTADGAQRAEVALRADGFEVAVGSDRYRIPAAMAVVRGE